MLLDSMLIPSIGLSNAAAFVGLTSFPQGRNVIGLLLLQVPRGKSDLFLIFKGLVSILPLTPCAVCLSHCPSPHRVTI